MSDRLEGVAPADASWRWGLALDCEKLESESLETWPKAAPRHGNAFGRGLMSKEILGGKVKRVGCTGPQRRCPAGRQALVYEKLQPESLATWPKATPHRGDAIGRGRMPGRSLGEKR
jgi:hypothetical protein